jgi:hypothetical protein
MGTDSNRSQDTLRAPAAGRRPKQEMDRVHSILYSNVQIGGVG